MLPVPHTTSCSKSKRRPVVWGTGYLVQNHLTRATAGATRLLSLTSTCLFFFYFLLLHNPSISTCTDLHRNNPGLTRSYRIIPSVTTARPDISDQRNRKSLPFRGDTGLLPAPLSTLRKLQRLYDASERPLRVQLVLPKSAESQAFFLHVCH